MKYNKSEIMKDAWKSYKNGYVKTFAEALRNAWWNAKYDARKAEEEARTGLRRMSYSEYKNIYSECKTVDGSYNKKTKTIEVMTKIDRRGNPMRYSPKTGWNNELQNWAF